MSELRIFILFFFYRVLPDGGTLCICPPHPHNSPKQNALQHSAQGVATQWSYIMHSNHKPHPLKCLLPPPMGLNYTTDQSGHLQKEAKERCDPPNTTTMPPSRPAYPPRGHSFSSPAAASPTTAHPSLRGTAPREEALRRSFCISSSPSYDEYALHALLLH